MADFEWFRSFVAIYRHGSVSAAAASRYMTQPALSQHLAALEAEIGEPLFRRTPRRMVPTERAKLLYAQIAQAVDRLERVDDAFKQPGRAPVLRLGGPSEFLHERIIPALPDSPYRLLLTFGETRPLLRLLQDGELDLLVATQHVATAGLVFSRLDVETFLPVGIRPLDIPSGADKQAVRAALEKERWISYGSDLPMIRRFWMQAFGVRCAILPDYVVPDLRIIKSMVLRGLGVSVLPDYLVRSELAAGILHVLHEPDHPAVNELWLVRRSADSADERLQAFAEALAAAAARP
jgi:DNA-binding transcriptional LysR family regulator